MAKLKTVFRCPECGAATPKWVGRCPGCGAWNTLVEEVDEPRPSSVAMLERASPTPITQVGTADSDPVPTGIDELDRVLCGGLVPGSVTLVGGEPGIGKSTLLLEAAGAWAERTGTVLYVSAEESAHQVQRRAQRVSALNDRLYLASATALSHVIAGIDQVKPTLVVLDSIQTVFDPELSSAPGSVTQVRECAHRLVRLAKERNIAIVLVGHVTKDGTIAGPRVLEHVVDTVLSFEGDRHHALRLLRAVKHRFGGTNELGLFEMTDMGLMAIPDASGLFLADRRPGVPGSVVVPISEGHRPLLVEMQALVATTSNPVPRRAVQGVEAGRLAMMLAVLERRAFVPLAGCDVFVSVVGGVRAYEPGADLGAALAIVSASWSQPLPPSLVACGELGLGGEVRQVSGTPRRLTEAARLGFNQAIIASSGPDDADGLEVIRVGTLTEAIEAAGLRRREPVAAHHGAHAARSGDAFGWEAF